MERRYLLFGGALFALVGGVFGIGGVLLIAVAALVGLVAIGAIETAVLSVVLFASLFGSAAAYLWFVSAA